VLEIFRAVSQRPLETMRNLIIFVLLFPAVLLAGQETPSALPQAVSSYRATLHEQLSSLCELVEPGTLLQYKQYEAVAVPGTTDEIYSPELGKGAFVVLSEAVPKNVLKLAKKSGFDLRVESTGGTNENDRATVTGSSCPDLQQAISGIKRQRDERRTELQKRLHTVGPDVLPPVPIRQVQPEPSGKQAVAQSSPKPKVMQGTVFLAAGIGIDGKVYDAKVMRPLDPVLDQKAIEVVRQWLFSPARMNGLPVPFQMTVEVSFRLD